MKHMTRKATRHVNQNEGLIFEKSSPGKAAWKLRRSTFRRSILQPCWVPPKEKTWATCPK